MTTEEVVEASESTPPSEEVPELSPISDEVIVPSPAPALDVTTVVIENDFIERSNTRISVSAWLNDRVIDAQPSSLMKVPPRYPAPEWFCDLLGTRKHHGNVKFLLSPKIRASLGIKVEADKVVTHYQFVKRLWAYLSYMPLNDEEFCGSAAFAPIFGKEVRKWSEIRVYLSDHVFFNSSFIGVFSGKPLQMNQQGDFRSA